MKRKIEALEINALTYCGPNQPSTSQQPDQSLRQI